MKVKINDFQIIKKADLEFLPGITAIVGDSNNGKSSIIRAIEYAINNKGGSGFINYGADFCEIAIEDNNHKIIWHKDRASRKSFYKLDNKQLDKIGQTQLEEVGQLLNMPEVNINNEKFRLNFWKQMEYPFLVGKTSYQLFEFISNSKEQELISELQDESAIDLKQLRKDIEYNQAKIDSKTSDITVLEESIAKLEKFNNFNIDQLEAISDIFELLSTNIQEFKSISDRKAATKNELMQVRSNYIILDKQVNQLNTYIDLFDTLYNVLENYSTIHNTISNFKKDLDDINNTINIKTKKVDTLDNIITEIKAFTEQYSIYQELAESLYAIKTQNKTTKDNIYNIEDEIKEINKELGEFKSCPLCGTSLDGGHTHGK
ncbi:MAG: hypothetical protein ACOCV8_02390 [Spirochaetota bacterium]